MFRMFLMFMMFMMFMMCLLCLLFLMFIVLIDRTSGSRLEKDEFYIEVESSSMPGWVLWLVSYSIVV